MHQLHIVQRPITDLNPAPCNPRRWNDEAIRQLTKSILNFTLVDSIINATPEQHNTFMELEHYAFILIGMLVLFAAGFIWANAKGLVGEKCPNCGKALVIRNGPYGKF